VLDKINYLVNVQAAVTEYNIPLSWAIYKNATSWIAMRACQCYYDAKTSFSYAKYDMPAERTKFIGATTESCPVNLQMSVQPNTAVCDF